MFEFVLARQLAGEIECLAQAVERGVLALAVSDVIQQLAGWLGSCVGTRRTEGEVVLHQRLAGFAFNAGERLAHAAIGGKRAIA